MIVRYQHSLSLFEGCGVSSPLVRHTLQIFSAPSSFPCLSIILSKTEFKKMMHHHQTQRHRVSSSRNSTTSPIATMASNRPSDALETSLNHDHMEDEHQETPEERINNRIKSILKKLPSKKEDNPIKFKSFYECIKDVKIISDVQYDTRRREDSKDETDTTTFFYDKMLEWDELNLTVRILFFDFSPFFTLFLKNTFSYTGMHHFHSIFQLNSLTNI